MTEIQDYPRRYCPVCGAVVQRDFRPGPGGRPDAACPRCVSLERHRFLAVLLDVLRPMLGDIDVLLDVAPTPQVTPLLDGLGARRSVRLDLGADNRLVDVLGSLTALGWSYSDEPHLLAAGGLLLGALLYRPVMGAVVRSGAQETRREDMEKQWRRTTVNPRVFGGPGAAPKPREDAVQAEPGRERVQGRGPVRTEDGGP